jgi:hypothetical protein
MNLMRKTILAVPRAALMTVSTAAFLAAVLAGSMLAGIAPAAANPAQDKIISNFCDGHPDANECNDWRYNRASWGDAQYQSFYMTHRGETEFTTADAAAAFSVSAQAPVPPPVNDQTATGEPAAPSPATVSTPTGDVVKTVPEVTGGADNHISDCQATFKSYDAATDTYMGLDGSRQKCKL